VGRRIAKALLEVLFAVVIAFFLALPIEVVIRIFSADLYYAESTSGIVVLATFFLALWGIRSRFSRRGDGRLTRWLWGKRHAEVQRADRDKVRISSPGLGACQHCGEVEFLPADRFCPNCGNQLADLLPARKVS
jgi:hypothetical protein